MVPIKPVPHPVSRILPRDTTKLCFVMLASLCAGNASNVCIAEIVLFHEPPNSMLLYYVSCSLWRHPLHSKMCVTAPHLLSLFAVCLWFVTRAVVSCVCFCSIFVLGMCSLCGSGRGDFVSVSLCIMTSPVRNTTCAKLSFFILFLGEVYFN